MRVICAFAAVAFLSAAATQAALAGSIGLAIREAAEHIVAKFGKGAAGNSVDEVAGAVARAVNRHGEEVLPLLRASGHAGVTALDQAASKAPEVIKLYVRRGDEAIWVISEPKRLAIFVRHGDSAADALLKHPGLSDDLIGRFGNDAVGALNSLSRSGAQRLGMAVDDGLLMATPRSHELLTVIQRYGDPAMDFIWKNKGALTVATLLTRFLVDPQVYISGVKQLVVEPVVEPIVKGVNWTLIAGGGALLLLLPIVIRRMRKADRGSAGGERN
jgi:hypothetical protein